MTLVLKSLYICAINDNKYNNINTELQMLKAEYIEKVRKDKGLMAKLMIISGKSEATLYRWLQRNDNRLTTSDVLSVIGDHFSVPYHDMVEPVTKKIIITETALS